MASIKIFVTYSHQDIGYLDPNSLLGFLKGLEHDNIELWTDKALRPGELWDDVIKAKLQITDIALVLVSQSFLDSYYCQTVEIKNFLEQRTHLVPVILSACEWQRHEWLKSRQFLPGGEQTIEEDYKDEGKRKRLFLKVRESLRIRAETLQLERKHCPDTPQEKWLRKPYPGLMAFTEDEAPIFFGRNQEVTDLMKIVSDPAQRFLAIIGASGSGKSSLVAAGLLPKLTDIDTTKAWKHIRLTPGEYGDDPFLALASSLKPYIQRSLDVKKIHHALQTTTDIKSLFETKQLSLNIDTELVIFIDQFEELFTLVAEEYRKPFAVLLGKMAETEHLRTIITMRADFYHHCLEYPPLDVLLRSGSYPLAVPELPAIMEMITGPAAIAGLSFEAGLSGQILRDTGTEPGSLALMAFALSELYEKCQPGKQMTRAAYASFGGVRGAIAKRADDVFKALDIKAKDAFEEVFKELVEVDPQSGTPTRKRCPDSHFTGSHAARQFIDKFDEARLLVRDGPDPQAVVEVAHEALLSHWPRLAAWIEIRKDDFRLRRQLQLAAQEWSEKPEDKRAAYLWSDERVMEARGMLHRLAYRPTESELAFLGPLEVQQMLTEIDHPDTMHERRALIGVRLSLIGDPRPGVGLRADGLPDIVWCPVPGGDITLEENAGTYTVAPFYMSKYLVTWAQFRSFLDAKDGFSNPDWWQGLWFQPDVPGRQFQKHLNCPVENVCWLEAIAYSRWLSERLGYEIYLPTEWEWQQAASGGNPDNVYPWGSEWNANYTNTYESGLSHSTAVGLYLTGATSTGILDMIGNLWEWCRNEYDNPASVDVGGKATRVVRGGSWNNDLDCARVADRLWDHPDYRSLNIGFRVVCLSPI